MSANTAKLSTPGCKPLEPRQPSSLPSTSIALKPRTPALALSVEQACEALGVSWDTWHASIEPDVRIVRLGRRKLIPVRELERWLDETAENVLERR